MFAAPCDLQRASILSTSARMLLLCFWRILLIAIPSAWSVSSDGDLLLMRFLGGIFGMNSLLSVFFPLPHKEFSPSKEKD